MKTLDKLKLQRERLRLMLLALALIERPGYGDHAPETGSEIDRKA